MGLWLRDVFQSRWGWSFLSDQPRPTRRVLSPGESVRISGGVRNCGLRLGTAYVRILIADSYALNQPVFDSHRDLSANARQALRLLDIPFGGFRRFSCDWTIPTGIENRHFDIRHEVWNPHFLFGGPLPYKFAESKWKGGFEVVGLPRTSHRPRVFVSYCWRDDAHKKWVQELVEELAKYDIDCHFDRRDLIPGDEATLFMESGVTRTPVRLLICSDAYTRKANSREPGGVGFETVISSHEYLLAGTEERAQFIPVVRDNGLARGRQLPTYLGSTWYCDMEGPDWRAEPTSDLVRAIRRHF